MVEIDDLGRCESCGTYVAEIELKGIRITDIETDKVSETLMCKECLIFLEDLFDTSKPYLTRKRPERATNT